MTGAVRQGSERNNTNASDNREVESWRIVD